MKKIISFISAFAMVASMFVALAVNVSASDTALTLETSSTGNKAGDVVTLVCKYSGYDVIPYDDGEGAGQKITGIQVRVNIPGGLGANAATGKQFLRGGVVNTPEITASGSIEWNWDMTNDQLTLVQSCSVPMNPNGKVFTVKMTLAKDITSDLEFTFANGYSQMLIYDNYDFWSLGDTVMVAPNTLTKSNKLLAPATAGKPIIDSSINDADADADADSFFVDVAIDPNGSALTGGGALVTIVGSTSKTKNIFAKWSDTYGVTDLLGECKFAVGITKAPAGVYTSTVTADNGEGTTVTPSTGSVEIQ